MRCHCPSVFATCIHCNQPLGANEALEEFPVGRRRLRAYMIGGGLAVGLGAVVAVGAAAVEDRLNALKGSAERRE